MGLFDRPLNASSPRKVRGPVSGAGALPAKGPGPAAKRKIKKQPKSTTRARTQ